jgi:hypothetical protein
LGNAINAPQLTGAAKVEYEAVHLFQKPTPHYEFCPAEQVVWSRQYQVHAEDAAPDERKNLLDDAKKRGS